MFKKNIYVVQPYQVGNRDRKSLAIIIPAQIAKEYSFDTSTIFALSVDDMKRITLQNVWGLTAKDLKGKINTKAEETDRHYPQPIEMRNS